MDERTRRRLERAAQRDPVTARLLEIIRRRRETQGMSLRELAQRMGVSPSYISMVETGQLVPDPERAARMGEILELGEPLQRAFRCWAELSRPEDATLAMRAARNLRVALEELEEEHPELAVRMLDRWRHEDLARPLARAEPLFEPSRTASPHRRIARGLQVPVVPEGTEPGRGRERILEHVTVDPNLLGPAADHPRLHAWRLSHHGVQRTGDQLRPGDYVVIEPSRGLPVQVGPEDLWVVRLREELVLTRLLQKGSHLVALPPAGSAEDLEFLGPKGSAVRGRVVLALRRW